MDDILAIRGVCKTYGEKMVLHQVNINLKRGRIYGLVGQNGAGKTTLMRIIGGLAFPDQGQIRLFGATEKKDLVLARKQLGYLMEDSSFYPYLTGEENMAITLKARGIANKDCIGDMLAKLGLADSGQKKVGDFSLGMKRRLGIALALLGKPKLLLLDEPTNGLDALGVLEIRALLQRLAEKEEVTMLISSHILGELSHLASDYIFIDKGNILQEITKQQLLACHRPHLVIKAEHSGLAIGIIKEKLRTNDFQLMPDGSILLYGFDQEITTLRRVFEGVATLEAGKDSLENYFISLIGGMDHGQFA